MIRLGVVFILTFLCFSADFTTILEEGSVTNGLRASAWKITTHDYKPCNQIYKNRKAVNDTGPVEPMFPGGWESFSKFLRKHVRYPAVAKENNTQGTVIVSVIVEKDGSLTDVKVQKGIGDGCDEEAVRVMKLSPPWKPGMQKGRLVRVMYSVPIIFSLSR